MRWNLAIGIVALAASLPVLAGELAGVSMPDNRALGDATLQLNGLGLRKKAIVKVYVGGLYLAEKASDPQAILASDAPRVMVMHFLRNVGDDKIVDGWRDGFANNASELAVSLQGEIDRFCSWWRNMKDEEAAVMTYVPGAGTRLEIAGMEMGTVAGKEFADALLLVWLGPNPPSKALKEGLLGK